MSVKTNGNEVNADNDFPAISSTGRFVAFESVGKFVSGDSGADADIFLRDRKLHKTTRISVKSNGNEVNGCNSEEASISGGGRFVAFSSGCALVGADTNGVFDIYVRDRQQHTTKRMSVKSNGDQGLDISQSPAISANGRFVAFQSDAPLSQGIPDANASTDIYVHDRKTGSTKRVSLKSDESELPGPAAEKPAISADGRFIAFDAYGPFTADPDYELAVDRDVFVRDRTLGKTRRASLRSNGTEADPNNNISSTDPAVSADGRLVAFQSDGPYVGGDTNNIFDIYVNDRDTNKTARVSIRTNGSQATTGGSALATISGSGRYVAFESYAKLVGGDNNTFRDVYLRDRKAKQTKRISVKSNGAEVDANHQLSAISADGRFVAFSSMGKFVSPDAGSDFDVFVRGPLF